MSETAVEVTVEVRLPQTPLSKFEREKRAFFRLLPALLATHAGQYVAIHEEQVVEFGADQAEVALRAQRQFGSVPIYVHHVSEDARPMCNSGLIRDLSQGEKRP